MDTLKALEEMADRTRAIRKARLPVDPEERLKLRRSTEKHIAKLERAARRAGDPGELGDIQDALDHYREELALLAE